MWLARRDDEPKQRYGEEGERRQSRKDAADAFAQVRFTTLAIDRRRMLAYKPTGRTRLSRQYTSRMQFGPAYSYRNDPDVPDFDDRQPIVVMDAECALCSFGARVIHRVDRRGEIRICPMQTRLGSALLRHYGLAPDAPDTWLLIEQGRAQGGFDAIVRVGLRSGGWGRSFVVLKLLPPSLRRRLYRWVAGRRYDWFGRGDLCALPAPGLRARLMLDPPA